jgi:hypothetical protein
MKIFFKKLTIYFCVILFPPLAFALDFIADGKFNPQTTKGYWVQSTDTIAGYPVFAPDGDWKIYHTFMGEITYGQQRARQPFIHMERYQSGKWVMAQAISVNIDSLGASSWAGGPCDGYKIIKINVVRGQLDRCATSEVATVRVGGVQTEVLKLKFTETNSGGRIYTSEFNIHFENLGFTSSAVTNTSSEFNIRLKDWMTKFQEALVKASGYDKPFDAFKDVPKFTDAVNASYVTPVAPPSTTQKQNSTSSPPTNIQEKNVYPFAAAWGGYDGLMAGTVTIEESRQKGKFKMKLPNNDGDCAGMFEIQISPKGTWAISCTNGMTAVGTYEITNNGKSSKGSGLDAKGNKVQFTVLF